MLLLLPAAICLQAQDRSHTKTNDIGIYDNLYDIYKQIAKHRTDTMCILLSDSMRRLAIAQHDKRAVAMSWAHPISYWMNKHNGTKVEYHVKQLMKASEEAQLWSFYYHALSQKNIFLVRHEHTSEALQLAEQTREKAYATNNRNGIYTAHMMLMTIYIHLVLYDRAIAEGLKAIDTEIGLPDNKFGSTLARLTECYMHKFDWQGCLDIIKRYEKYVKNDRSMLKINEARAVSYYFLGNKAEYNKWKKIVNEEYEKIGKGQTIGSTQVLELIKYLEDGNKQKSYDVLNKNTSAFYDTYYWGKWGRRFNAPEQVDTAIGILYKSTFNVLERLYQTDVKKYGLQLENSNLERHNAELEMEHRQLLLNNQNLELHNQNLSLEQRMLLLQQSQDSDKLEKVGLRNKYLEEQTKHNTMRDKLLQQQKAEELHRQRVLWASLLGVAVLLGILAFYFAARRNNRRLQKANTILGNQKRQLEESIEALQAANNANDAKTSFLFNMSHDIRTPMNAIIGFRDLLEKHQDNPERRADYLKKIDESSHVLLSIINNVLEMARIEKGTIVIEETPVLLDDYIDTVCNIFSGMMSQKGLRFTHSIDTIHHHICCDTTKLQEVYSNLLSNAYKYTNAGGTVDFSIAEVPSDSEGYVMLKSTISDTGIGMSSDFLPHLFEEFSREVTSTESKIEGTGLGMPIVKRLVELMHGTITVESEQGRGTTFTINLPHKIADSNTQQSHTRSTLGDLISENATDTQHPSPDIQHPSLAGRRILLAEDNELNAEIATELLEDMGITVERAEDGSIAVDMVQRADSGYYDCILMDVQMPAMNGYEATKAIRALNDSQKAAIPIIAMTANAFEEDKRNAIAAGMNGHIAKPIDPAIVIQTITKAIR